MSPRDDRLLAPTLWTARAIVPVLVAATRQWHRVAPGFVATTAFTALLLVTTVLHWDSFNHDHVSFWDWLGLYASTPVLLPVLWRNNQRTDPGPITGSPAGETRVPGPRAASQPPAACGRSLPLPTCRGTR